MTEMMQEMREIRALARQFAQEQLRPNAERWDRERMLDTDVIEQVAELGFFGMRVPESDGGMAFDLPTYLAAIEELAWGEPVVALQLIGGSQVAAAILRGGDADQRRRWLEPIAAGTLRACVAVAEAGGDDPRAIETRARRDGDDWVLDGEKRWVSGGASAGVALVLACTDGSAAGAAGLGVFLVPTDAEGYEAGARETTLGLRALELVPVSLRGVRLSAGALLGEAGAGSELWADGLPEARLAVAAIALGIARSALEHARDYAAQREQFGRALRTFEGVQFKLADMVTRVRASRALIAEAATSPDMLACSAAKLFAAESAMWVTTQAVQIFGGYGYMRDYPVEKLMRDAKATEIIEGTNDIHRLLIAQELYGA